MQASDEQDDWRRRFTEWDVDEEEDHPTRRANRAAIQVEQLAQDAPVQRPTFACRDAPSAGGDPTSPVAERLVHEVLGLFSRFDAELDAYAAQVRQVATTASRGEGVNGRIIVTIVAGQVSGVDVDARWASAARHTEIRAEAMSAFRAVWRQAASRGSHRIPIPPSIARLQELASDPEALSRQLGLSR